MSKPYTVREAESLHAYHGIAGCPDTLRILATAEALEQTLEKADGTDAMANLVRACRETVQWMDSFLGRDGYKVDVAKMIRRMCQKAIDGAPVYVVGDGNIRRLESERDEARAEAERLKKLVGPDLYKSELTVARTK